MDFTIRPVVLGNSVFEDGTPKRVLKARLDRAVELYQLGLFPVIIVSGADLPGDREVPGMTRYLTEHNIPLSAIIEDAQGIDTDATGKNLAKIFQERHLGSVTVITHFYHISRCKLALQHYGIQNVHQAHAGSWSLPNALNGCRDVLAYWYYDIRYSL